ncbi:hypothetical protein CcCBS67573_g09273 [Chytriomyces confervae]|uniref:DDE Tnp4 domain-containing protein n=1 Tax=Chytriomyces confervae TaxID=246404 RepID=A0A507E055_9FUNG|nr:hypothetical protein CcCBS67573_g09273 [Chytriomyces confervae]
MAHQTFLRLIEPGERVAADQGYRGDPWLITKMSDTCAAGITHNCNLKQMGPHHETVNKRFKDFQILTSLFQSDRNGHSHIFKAVFQITQVKLCQQPLYRLQGKLQ